MRILLRKVLEVPESVGSLLRSRRKVLSFLMDLTLFAACILLFSVHVGVIKQSRLFLVVENLSRQDEASMFPQTEDGVHPNENAFNVVCRDSNVFAKHTEFVLPVLACEFRFEGDCKVVLN